jgi:hypothetical protein
MRTFSVLAGTSNIENIEPITFYILFENFFLKVSRSMVSMFDVYRRYRGFFNYQKNVKPLVSLVSPPAHLLSLLTFMTYLIVWFSNARGV